MDQRYVQNLEHTDYLQLVVIPDAIKEQSTMETFFGLPPAPILQRNTSATATTTTTQATTTVTNTTTATATHSPNNTPNIRNVDDNQSGDADIVAHLPQVDVDVELAPITPEVPYCLRYRCQ